MNAPAARDVNTDAAILLMLLSEPQAASIVAELSPDEIERVGSAMSSLSRLDAVDAESALDRFVVQARKAKSVDVDGLQKAEAILGQALGEQRTATIIGKFRVPSAHQQVATLRWLSTDALVDFIVGEHPQVGAAILTDLPPARAAMVLAALPTGMQDDLVHRVSKLGSVASVAYEMLDDVLSHMANGQPTPADPANGVSAAAAIVSKLPRPADQVLLKALGKRDKQLAQTISDEMFVFADVPALPTRDRSNVVRAIDTEVLTLALKGLPSEQRELMLAGLSQRAAQAIRDEIEDRGPVPLAEVEAAQKQIVAVVRRMERDGAIELGGSGDSAYV